MNKPVQRVCARHPQYTRPALYVRLGDKVAKNQDAADSSTPDSPYLARVDACFIADAGTCDWPGIMAWVTTTSFLYRKAAVWLPRCRLKHPNALKPGTRRH